MKNFWKITGSNDNEGFVPDSVNYSNGILSPFEEGSSSNISPDINVAGSNSGSIQKTEERDR